MIVIRLVTDEKWFYYNKVRGQFESVLPENQFHGFGLPLWSDLDEAKKCAWKSGNHDFLKVHFFDYYHNEIIIIDSKNRVLERSKQNG